MSADLTELARTPVAVVCAGAKSILDLSGTLEVLETNGVPVVGYGTDEFPAFYVRSSGLPVGRPRRFAGGGGRPARGPLGAGRGRRRAGSAAAGGGGLDPGALAMHLEQAERLASEKGIRGPALTPFLLARLAEISDGATLRANRALVVANARLAARVAVALVERP